jgi:homoserine O-acetyltransferase
MIVCFDIMKGVEEKYEQQGVGVVSPRITTLTLPPGGFTLEEGGCLSRVDVAWESCGLEKPENDNVVFICHALTGDAHVAGRYEGEEEPTGWWEGIVGPGRAIDTNRYRVICANVLGGCKGTTGPSSINPDTGKPYGSAFPKFTIGDTVNVVDGIFAGYSGVLQTISEDKKQLGILVSTEKRDFPIMVDAKDVRVAE